MNKTIKAMVAVLAMLATGVAFADTEVVGGIEWTYTVSDGEASVGGGNAIAVPTSTTGAITIPSTLGGCRVTSIGDSAFFYCSGLTSVVIPEGVTSIGVMAFYSCRGLKSVTIQEGVTSIGVDAFNGCSGLTSMTIPSSVTSIDGNAFAWCGGLMKFIVDNGNPNYKSVNGLLLTKDGATLIAGINGDVTIPEGVTSIGEWAFAGCSGLTSVTIPESVTNIGEMAFYGCSGLGDGVVIVDDCVLTVNGECPSVVELPQGTCLIAGSAFSYCSGLASVKIPSSVTSIGEGAFAGCSGLTGFIVDEGNQNYKIVNGLLLTKDGTELVAGLNGDVQIPSSVTSIGEYAFSGRTRLTSVVIPEGVTSIGKAAFEGCSGLKSVTIPSSVTSIGKAAFFGCTGLTSVTIPSNVTSIGEDAFVGCTGLTSVTIPSSVTSIGEDAFAWCGGLMSVTIPSSVTSIGGLAFYYCSGLTSVTIPSSVTSIGWWAFQECCELKTVYVDKGDASRVRQMLEESEFDTAGVAFKVAKDQDGGEVEPDGGDDPDPTPDPDPVPDPTPVVVTNAFVEEIVPIVIDEDTKFAAATYDGYLCRESDGAVVGTVTVKAAAGKMNKKTGTTTTKLTISVQLADSTKKVSISGEYDLTAGGEQTFTKSGHSITLLLGSNGLTGSFEGYRIEGVPNVYSAKDAASKAAASAADAAYVGSYNLIADEGAFTVAVAKKGKVKVSGTTADGKKVSVSAQLIVGDGIACVPVIAAKSGLAFTVWMSSDDAIGTIASTVDGLTDAVIGKPGTLASGAMFTLDADELSDMVGDSTYADYFPSAVAVSQSGTKWIVAGGAKAGKVVLKSDKSEVDETKLGDNPSALKLTYTAKTGVFKGSFLAYVNVNDKPKALSATVTGVMVNGVGYGTATIKKYGSVDIVIR